MMVRVFLYFDWISTLKINSQDAEDNNDNQQPKDNQQGIHNFILFIYLFLSFEF